MVLIRDTVPVYYLQKLPRIKKQQWRDLSKISNSTLVNTKVIRKKNKLKKQDK